MKLYLLFVGVFIFNINSFACSCDSMPFKHANDMSDEIFIGQIISQKLETKSKNFNGEKYIDSSIRTTFKIDKKWKGSGSQFLSITQPSTCATPFEIQRYTNYIVYAIYDKEASLFDKFLNENLSTYACLRNADLGYNEIREGSSDDRPLLNKKYIKVKLRDNRFDYYLLFFGILLFVFIFRMIFLKFK